MTADDDCLEDFVHPLFHELMGKNEGIEERYGPYDRWHWDEEAIALTFSGSVKPTIRIDVTVVGSTEGNSGQWSWANRNWDAKAKVGMDEVREFGEANGYEMLTLPFLSADEYTGWEMTSVAAHVLNAQGAYRFPTDEGYCYLIYRNIEVL
jgi:hypothetical protein